MIKKITMENLTCSSCAGKIESELIKKKNIDNATFNFATQTMILEVTEDFNENIEITYIKKIVDSIETGVETYLPSDKTTQQKKKKYLSTFLIGLILYGITIFVLPFKGIPQTLLIYLSYILVSRTILTKTFKGLKRKDYFNENTLMFIATIAAMLLQEYNEALLVVVFYSFGEFLQGYAVKSSKNEIKGLMDLKIEFASVKYHNKILLKDPSEVEIGDIIIVKNGEKIPVDGTVIKGISELNTSALTGETKLLNVNTGDNVLSGNINVGSVIEIEATTTYENSTVAKIIDLIENSTNQKATPEKFITKFSKFYTPSVTIFAFLMFLIPTLIMPENVYDYAYRSATFLVISCPCALVLSIPLSYFSGIGASAKEGILFKGSTFLDLLLNIDHIALDKTGTITKGNFAIESFSNEETLLLAASIEQFSSHPIAQSIAKERSDDLLDVTDVEEVPGKGLVGSYNNEKIYVGNSKLLKDNDIVFTEIINTGTIIYVAKGSKYLGYITVKDEIKETSYEFIKSHRNINFTMLTGDNEKTAQEVASKVGNISYKSSLLPEDKIKAFNEIETNKLKMFVGDGINDAPLLKVADIGVAMGQGSELAIDVADVIIMDNDLNKLSTAFNIAKKTRKIVIQNIILTLGLKFLIIVLASFGLSSMLAAIFADVGVSLIAVLNSLRIIFGKKKNKQLIYRDELFKVLSDATVLSLLDTLYQQERTIDELADILKKSSFFIRKKLRLLLNMKIIKKTEKQNIELFSITDEHIKNIISQSKQHVYCGK